jgi:hypothetical protein
MGQIPSFITSADWANISGLLAPFWVLFGAVLGFASSMLFAQAVIPSLATARALPSPHLVKLRTPLYLSAAIFLALAIFMVVVIFDRVGILGEIFHFGFI